MIRRIQIFGIFCSTKTLICEYFKMDIFTTQIMDILLIFIQRILNYRLPKR